MEPPYRTKEVAGVRYASVVPLPWDLERELRETVRMKLGFPQRPEMLKIKQLWDTYWKKTTKGSRSGPRDRSILQSTKLKGIEDLKSKQVDKRQGDAGLEIVQLVFHPVLPHYAVFLYFRNNNIYQVPLYVGNK